MDVLILSCGTGGGHHAAGRALKEELSSRGHCVQLLNPYDLQGKRTAVLIDQAYIKLVQKAPAVFGWIYKIGDVYRKLPFRSPVYFVNSIMVGVMREFLEKNHFDIIFTTHLYPAEILTNMKRRGISVPKVMFIATDYACIPFTEETDCDAYIIPAPELTGEFSGRGIPIDKIYPLGIPVQRCFSEVMPRWEAKRRLGLNIDRRYILVSGGSMGAGKIEKVIKLLYQRFCEEWQVKILVICGSNKKLFTHLERKYGSKIELVGHTDEMAVYLKVCDLYLTKPGGLSTTEAAVTGIPIIHLSPIPGCETCNAHFFVSQGLSNFIGAKIRRKNDFFDVISLWENPKGCYEMICRQRAKINANAAAQICDMAEKWI